ncbi:MAG: nucleotidyl transferase AbiEii/AbiGii toxin family protein [Bacteroidetes bacterium]|nr:nucleotidyl transferase AbiEii/AbiGii toxin family protein [Bacteroidota bacterium]
MLYNETVEKSTLELIVSLQSKTYLNQFHLAGLTALALYLGHRKSVDIDLFSNFSFGSAELLENLHQDFPYKLYFTASNTLKGSIDSVNVDILAHRYKLIDIPKTISGISVLSEQDIIAMKLNAISLSGTRSKDFIDIYYLLSKYSIGNMLDFYKEKYNQQNDTFILKSLIYFTDVDLADYPVLIKDPLLKWSDVKRRIEKAVLNYLHGKQVVGN